MMESCQTQPCVRPYALATATPIEPHNTGVWFRSGLTFVILALSELSVCSLPLAVGVVFLSCK
jgi:hypothetical protein